VIDLLIKYAPAFISGAIVTLQLALIVWGLGLVLGVLLGALRARLKGVWRELSSVFFLGLASVPILVYLLWAYYPLQRGLGVNIPAFATAAGVLALYNAIGISDIVRGAILNFPNEYGEAGRALGIPPGKLRRFVMTPLIIQSTLPGYIASQVGALHMTLFASLISVDELFRQAQRVNSIEYQPVEVFSLLAIFYFALSFPLLMFSKWLEAKTSFERT
jgi:His/Glu/Gln/Arg/opine family amino acid ABC transporter permease subunit